MDNEKIELIKKKVQVLFKKEMCVHISMNKKGIWRNGFIREISSDFFMLDVQSDGLTPIFYLEIFDIEPYVPKEEEKDGGTDN